MKIDRLIGILTILLQREKVTAPELAKRFEVSRRTINRDIEDICKAGIPLVTTQGYGGGIAIAQGYKIEKTFFTQEELQAVLAGVRGVDSVSASACLESLRDKLAGANPRVEAEDTILIDLSAHDQASLAWKIETIRRSIRARQTLCFSYFYQKGETRRTIEPYRLLFKWSDWYVLGYCLDRQAFRLFKLRRLWALNSQGTPFAPRHIPQAELDFDRYFQAEPIHLSALFDTCEKYRLIEEYGVNCFTQGEDGLRFEWDFVSYPNMREWILSFGRRVRVLAPRRLIDDCRRQAQGMLKLYGGT